VAPLSEYGKELREKQKLKAWYNLEERQFKKYVKEVLEKRGRVEDAGALLIKKLESRLDNVIFRLGFAASRSQARQLVSHGFFLVNNRRVDVPSFQVKKGDQIKISPTKLKKGIFQNLELTLKKHQPPSWLKLDPKKFEAQVIGEPSVEEAAPPAELSSIFEFYSR
jgi:small subunit ribosomal protein S4